MLFGVEDDHGASIDCHLVPDAGGTTPSLRVLGGGRQLAVVSATVIRPEFLASGRHATGLCGFHIASVPDLGSYADLELREASTGLLVYKRPQSTQLANTKVFRLEMHLLPLRRFDEAFKDRFQYWYEGIERHGLETTMHTFRIPRCTSLYLSGRLMWQGIQALLPEFKRLIVLRDPFHELAERLLVLKNLRGDQPSLLGARDLSTFQCVIEFLSEVDAFDARFCKTFVKRAPAEVLKALANPFVRQLASHDQAELPKNALATALQALSSFDVVGVRDDAEAFSNSVAEILDAGRPLPLLRDYSKVVELGDRLRQFSKVDTILDKDLDIFESVKQAFASVATREEPRPRVVT